MTPEFKSFVIDPYTDTSFWHPTPLDFQTAQTMDAGEWGGIAYSRGGADVAPGTAPPCYQFLSEFSFPKPSLADGTTARLYGLTWITPQLAAQTHNLIALQGRAYAKKMYGTAGVTVKVGMALYVWQADNTLGTMVFDNLTSTGITQSYAPYTMGSSYPLSLGVGDRLCLDVWLEVDNQSGGAISGEHGYLAWGTITYNARFVVGGKTGGVSSLAGIMTNRSLWGAL